MQVDNKKKLSLWDVFLTIRKMSNTIFQDFNVNQILIFLDFCLVCLRSIIRLIYQIVHLYRELNIARWKLQLVIFSLNYISTFYQSKSAFRSFFLCCIDYTLVESFKKKIQIKKVHLFYLNFLLSCNRFTVLNPQPQHSLNLPILFTVEVLFLHTLRFACRSWTRSVVWLSGSPCSTSWQTTNTSSAVSRICWKTRVCRFMPRIVF